MPSYQDYLNDYRSDLESKRLVNRDVGGGSFPGALAGVTRFPNYVVDPLTVGYNNLVLAPAASAIDYWFQNELPSERKERLLREKREYNERLKNRLDSQKTSVSGNRIQRAFRKPYDNMSSRGRSRRRLQSGKPPIGARRVTSSGQTQQFGYNMDGQVGWWSLYRDMLVPNQRGGYTPERVTFNPRNGRPVHLRGRDRQRPSWVQRQRLRTRSQVAPARVRALPNQRAPPPGRARNIDYRSKKSDGLKIASQPQSGEQFKDRGTRMGVQSWDVRIFAGQLVYKNAATTPLSGIGPGSTSWIPQSGGSDIGGQWYALGTQTCYFGDTNPLANLLSYYEEWGLDGEVDFVPCISGFSNPDIRLSVLATNAIDLAESTAAGGFVGGVKTAKATLVRSYIMSNPGTCTKPGWTDTGFTCKLPHTTANGGWFKVNSPLTGNSSFIMDFTLSTAAFRQSCPFAVFVNISGTIPATVDLIVADVYFNLRVKARNQRSIQTSGANYQKPIATTLESLERKLEDLLLHGHSRELKYEDEKGEIDFFIEQMKKYPVEERKRIFYAAQEQDEDLQEFIRARAKRSLDLRSRSRSPVKKKSSSNKSNSSKPPSWVEVDDNKFDSEPSRRSGIGKEVP